MLRDFLRKVRDTRRLIIRQSAEIEALSQRLEDVQLSLGRVETQLNRQMSHGSLWDFQVFSQWNEDGILQWILNCTAVENRRFVELGVGDYRESNTRFLLRKDYWEGLVIDADKEAIQRLHKDAVTWRHSLRVIEAFITCENINQLIRDAGFSGDIGVLSIDLDGNDYWIWNAINVINPRIVILEYNGLLPPSEKVSIPYTPNFRRAGAHPSLGYWGASLSAFEYLARQRSYALVAINNAGSNAFFVRQDVLNLPGMDASHAHRYPGFREARDDKGMLQNISPRQTLELIAGLTVVDVQSGKTSPIREVLSRCKDA